MSVQMIAVRNLSPEPVKLDDLGLELQKNQRRVLMSRGDGPERERALRGSARLRELIADDGLELEVNGSVVQKSQALSFFDDVQALASVPHRTLLRSPSGHLFEIRVDDDGLLHTYRRD